jgi:hypothetical protein
MVQNMLQFQQMRVRCAASSQACRPQLQLYGGIFNADHQPAGSANGCSGVLTQHATASSTHLLACASNLLLSCHGSCACMLLFWCSSACSLCRRSLSCGLSSRGFAAGNAYRWSTRTAASVGCGWHQPTSHCACPLNFCLFSGNYGGLTKCVHAQPSPLLPGR